MSSAVRLSRAACFVRQILISVLVHRLPVIDSVGVLVSSLEESLSSAPYCFFLDFHAV